MPILKIPRAALRSSVLPPICVITGDTEGSWERRRLAWKLPSRVIMGSAIGSLPALLFLVVMIEKGGYDAVVWITLIAMFVAFAGGLRAWININRELSLGPGFALDFYCIGDLPISKRGREEEARVRGWWTVWIVCIVVGWVGCALALLIWRPFWSSLLIGVLLGGIAGLPVWILQMSRARTPWVKRIGRETIELMIPSQAAAEAIEECLRTRWPMETKLHDRLPYRVSIPRRRATAADLPAICVATGATAGVVWKKIQYIRTRYGYFDRPSNRTALSANSDPISGNPMEVEWPITEEAYQRWRAGRSEAGPHLREVTETELIFDLPSEVAAAAIHETLRASP